MERAKELLEQPDIKIMDIAERLGYADNHYFSKAFPDLLPCHANSNTAIRLQNP